MRVAIIFRSLTLFGCQSLAVARSVDAQAQAEVRAADPFAIVAEAGRLAERELWPRFDPRSIPVAIYDGERTLLFRHPAPPAGFEPLMQREDVWVFAGRHPSVTANSSVELGGVQIATLVPSPEPVSIQARAAVLVHEAFHVFQREHHPAWAANEVELFTYPTDDAALLALRRSESEALRRALEANAVDEAGCWAQQAISVRRERLALLAPGAAAYERMSELNEGLADYVARRATGAARGVLPVEEFAPEAIRARAYRSGAALALLLDRFSAGWRTMLAQNDTLPLDDLLSRALRARARVTRVAAACSFTAAERKAISALAAADVEELRGRRAEQKIRFLDQPGWIVVIVSPGGPLFPQGFDPLNVHVVTPGEVLHTRFLRLGNQAGTIEVLGRPVLTEAAGTHPLFNGVRSVTLAGFAAEPAVSEVDGAVRFEADGVNAELRGSVERNGQTVTIRIAT